jgi:heme exporter protein C
MWTFINTLLSPKKFFIFSGYITPWLTLLFVLSSSYGLIGALVLAPADYMQGDGFRILYVHVPCAFLSLFVYAVMSCAAICLLVFRLKMAALVIKHSIPLGASFTLLALITGSIWGKPMWGTWWIWDARLTSELILLFLYSGILILQSAINHKRNADKTVAILTLVGFVDLPIIHYSVYWWNTLHQGSTIKLLAPSSIAPEMLYPLLSMLVAFLSYYTLVLFLRLRYELTAGASNHHWLETSSC